MALHVEHLVTPRGQRQATLALLHGFTQNSRCWGPFVEALQAEPGLSGIEIVAVDAAGHGLSDPAHDDVDLWVAGDLTMQAVGPAIYLGYSMGGRTLLHAALGQLRQTGPIQDSIQDSIQGMILLGSTAGIEQKIERAKRREADEALAARLESDGLETFLDDWLANPLFAGLPEETAARSERLTNRADGLAASLRYRGTGAQESLWDRLDEITCPTLVVAGKTDTKFAAIGRRLQSAIAVETDLALPDGGHAIHLESPQAVARLVAAFVTSLVARS